MERDERERERERERKEGEGERERPTKERETYVTRETDNVDTERGKTDKGKV